MPSTRSRIIYKLYKLIGSPFDARTPIAQQKTKMEKQARFLIMPSHVEVTSVSIGRMHAEWLRPHGARNDRAILYLHGGGYTMGSCNTHRSLASRIAIASQAPALIIEYRLAPEDPYPAALQDVKAAYHWLLEQKINAPRIVVAGDSAGGGLAVALAITLRDEGASLPGGIVCLSAWLDLTLSGETILTCAESDPLISQETSIIHASSYIGQHDARLPLISPVFADLNGLPPLFIQVGENEILKSDSLRLAENARMAGVEATLQVWGGMWHVWHMYAGLVPESKRAIDRIGWFISECMKA